MELHPRTISVVTGVRTGLQDDPEGMVYAHEAMRSLMAEAERIHAKGRWRVQWCLEFNEEPASILRTLMPNPPSWVSIGYGPNQGPADVHNRGASRATGSHIMAFAIDDVLPAGALSLHAEAFETHRHLIGWSAGLTRDLTEDKLSGPKRMPPAGLVVPGDLTDAWRRDGHRLSIHPAAVCYDTGLFFFLGGWSANGISADTTLLLRAAELVTGHFDLREALHYRKWRGQSTRSLDIRAGQPARVRFTDRCVEAAASFWRGNMPWQ